VEDNLYLAVLGVEEYVITPLVMGRSLDLNGTTVLVACLFWGVVLTIWFWFVWIPFEEKELDALFGDSYREYKRRVPKLFPNGRSYKT
jgi:protein-S-isoprenylcysteine O-methyltransferase Ste14